MCPIIQHSSFGTRWEISFRWNAKNLANEKPSLVRAMTCYNEFIDHLRSTNLEAHLSKAHIRWNAFEIKIFACMVYWINISWSVSPVPILYDYSGWLIYSSTSIHRGYFTAAGAITRLHAWISWVNKSRISIKPQWCNKNNTRPYA